jgi:glycosylphosphatidylinositol phospholipase D
MAVAGESVSGVGDINGDGFEDFAIGSPGAADYHGEAYVVFGRAGGYVPRFPLEALLPGGGGRGQAGFALRNAETGSRVGALVSSAGDVNGDGIDDLIVGTGNETVPGYVVFGRDGGFPPVVSLRALHPGQGGNGTDGFLLVGREVNRWPTAVAGIGDVNGDGIDDVLVGFAYAHGESPYAGRCYVVFGRSTPFEPALLLGQLLEVNGGDGSLGFVIFGDDRADRACYSAGAAGDMNGDGTADLNRRSADGRRIGRAAAHGRGLRRVRTRVCKMRSDGTRRGGRAYVVFGRCEEQEP